MYIGLHLYTLFWDPPVLKVANVTCMLHYNQQQFMKTG